MDEISAAFAMLRPEDLIRGSSYTDHTPHSAERIQTGNTQGLRSFSIWVNSHLSAINMAAEQHPPTSFAVMSNGFYERWFRPEGDETVDMYATRLRREAQTMEATWFFNAMVAPGAYHEPEHGDVEPVDADDENDVRQALETGRLTMSVCWYAAIDEPDDTFERGGVIPIVDGELVQGVEGYLDPEQNAFSGVLGA